MTDTPTKFEEAAEPLVKAIIMGDSGILDFPLAKNVEQGQSQRLKGDRFSNVRGQIEPVPFNVNIFAMAPDLNVRLRRSIDIMATNIAGFGWKLVPNFKVTEDTPREKQEQVKQEISRVEGLFKNPNNEMPFSALMEMVITDLETLGNGYMEVVRNQNTESDPLGEIVELWHVPASTVRILKEGEGFIQIKGTRKRFYKKFGDPTVIDAKTGQEKDGIPLKARGNELIHFKIYSVASDFYGVPRWLPSSPSIAGVRFAAIRNVSFFENDTIPRGMILVSGGKIQNESVEMLRQFFTMKGGGPENAHRLAVVQVEPKGSTQFSNQPKTMIEWVPVTVGMTEDASFLEYMRFGNEEIREAFGIARIFYTEADTNRAGGVEARSITNDQTFEPERCRIEFRINATIVKSFGVELTKFMFQRPELVDPLNQAKIDQIYARTGSLTPNEIRVRTLDLPPYPEEFDLGDVPIQVSIVDRQLSARDAQTELDMPDIGAIANEPPGGSQDLLREGERDVAEIMSRIKEQFGEDVVIKMNGREYDLSDFEDIL